MDKIILYIKQLFTEKFTGRIEIQFNKGGIQRVRKIEITEIQL
jgi:hypothetical protein